VDVDVDATDIAIPLSKLLQQAHKCHKMHTGKVMNVEHLVLV